VTVTSIKVRVQRKANLKTKVIPRFPSNVEVQSPILLDRTGGAYNFSLDEDQLRTDIGAPSIADIVAYSAASQAYSVASQASATASASSAAAAAASASFLAASLPTYSTRAAAAAATISANYAAIQIIRHTTGYPSAPAVYIPGTVAGPMAFPEAGGHYWELDISGKQLLLPWFGAKGDGTATDTTATQAAVTAASGRRLDGMGLSYKITATITGVDNIEIVNAQFIQSSQAAYPPFSFTNKTNWQFRRVRLTGDGDPTLNYASGWTGALGFSNSTSSDLTGIAVEDCTFENFAGNYIINGAITGSGGIKNARFKRNRVLSDLGANYVDQVRIWLSLFASGASAATTGRYFDTDISENYIDANSLTIGIAPWTGHTRISIKNNFILNPGARSLFNSAVGTHNCYGMIGGYDTVGAVGNTTTCGQDGEISGNTIVSPPSAGIYFATAMNFNVHDNTISGQSRTDESTLPRGGIVGNDLRKSKIHHNRLINGWGGVAVVTNTGGSDVTEIADNEIYGNSATDSFGVRLGAPVGTATTNGLAVRRNLIRLTGTASEGVRSLSTSTVKYGSVVVEGNDIISPFKGINFASSFLVGSLTLKENRYGGVLSSIGLSAASVSGTVFIQNETFDLGSATGFGMTLDSSTVFINGAQFNGKTSGSVCISGVSAVGAIEGVSFRGCTASLRVAASSLGYSIPTNTGTPGDYVQNLNPDLTGASVTFGGWYFKTGTTWITGP
jgi:hypothetical protein